MYDYVIVGAGSAGCVLAHRLTEDPAVKVALLDAGTDNRGMNVNIPAAFTKLFKTKYDWNYSTEPQPQLNNRRLYWPRGKMLGGSSCMNAQMHVRGNSADYDGWSSAGNDGWSYQDVLPYFKRSEDSQRGASEYRGTGGPLTISALRDVNPATTAFVAAASEAGIARCADVNAASQDGVDFTQVTQRGGKRCSVATAYLIPVLRRPNLSVITGAHATRVLLNKGAAVGVEYVARGRTTQIHAQREVVIAGGAINSPQLLMLSGIGPAAHLRARDVRVEHDLPGVGSNLQDHLLTVCIANSGQSTTLVAAESLPSLARFMLFRRGMLTSNVAEACAFVRTDPALPHPDVELVFAPVPFLDHGLTKPDGHGISIGVVLLQPESRGRVELRSSDPFAEPSIDPQYLSDDGGADMRTMIRGVRLGCEVLSSHALSAHVRELLMPRTDLSSDEKLAAFVRARAETIYHPVGTCRMGADDMAVVDAQLRVRGVGRLRVVDASVMPRLIRGHTNAPTVMIAEKAADLIRGKTIEQRN